MTSEPLSEHGTGDGVGSGSDSVQHVVPPGGGHGSTVITGPGTGGQRVVPTKSNSGVELEPAA